MCQSFANRFVDTHARSRSVHRQVLAIGRESPCFLAGYGRGYFGQLETLPPRSSRLAVLLLRWLWRCLAFNFSQLERLDPIDNEFLHKAFYSNVAELQRTGRASRVVV